MPADLLIVTPSASLGESVRRILDETKLYRCHIVNNKASAVVRADEIGVPLAMLDAALGEDWVLEIGNACERFAPGSTSLFFAMKAAPHPHLTAYVRGSSSASHLRCQGL
jgi:diaminopimelate decarboxylase